MSVQISGHHCPDKLIHNINHLDSLKSSLLLAQAFNKIKKSQEGGWGAVWKKVKVLSKKCIYIMYIHIYVYILFKHRKLYGDSQRPEGKGVGGRWRWAKWGKMGTERNFAWGSGHTVQCADAVLLSCTLDTCMILWTNVISINSIKSHKYE